jgi:hypothetical protein
MIQEYLAWLVGILLLNAVLDTCMIRSLETRIRKLEK